MPDSSPVDRMAARGAGGIVQQRVLVWLGVAIVAVVLVLFFPKRLSLHAAPGLIAGLLALLAIGEITVRILDWVRKHLGRANLEAAQEPVGPLLERLSVGDVVFHRLDVAPGLIDHLVFRADGVVFLIETHPASGTVAKDGSVFKLNGRPLPIQLFKQAHRKLEWLGHFLAQQLRCTPRLEAGLVFPNAHVAAGYDSDGVALLGLEHLQPWLETAPPDEQFSKRLWPQMPQLQRELLACSKPPPQLTGVLPLAVVLLLGAAWLALGTPAEKPPSLAPLAAQPAQPTGRSLNKIQLEGLSGVPPHCLAIINGQTVRQGEWTIVKVAGRDVGIRCESIVGESAIIAVEGMPGTTTLHLRQGAGETANGGNHR